MKQKTTALFWAVDECFCLLREAKYEKIHVTRSRTWSFIKYGLATEYRLKYLHSCCIIHDSNSMTPQIENWIKNTKKLFIKKPGRVLEIGSKDITGSVREFFNDAKEYIGTDMERGFGVDVIIDAHDLLKKFKKNSFDGLICCEMLEHDNDPFKTIGIMNQLVKKGGFLIVTTPTFGFPLHRHPKDYFRYGEDAFREIIFKGFEILKLDEIKDVEGNPAICCIGKKI